MQGDDPRLEPLPTYRYPRDRFGQSTFGEEGDPRLLVDALEERGFKFESFQACLVNRDVIMSVSQVVNSTRCLAGYCPFQHHSIILAS